MKILTILGARPQFIKAATFSASLNDFNKTGSAKISERILHTGQHYNYELSRQIIEQLGLPLPYMNLGIGSGNHSRVTGEMMIKTEVQILAEKPDWVLVYGDTNSTLAGALAAAKLNTRVCHIEAGLRSFNRNMPEEINRVLTDHVSDLLFAPTMAAVTNLRNENIHQGVHHVGDIMHDAALRFGELAGKQPDIRKRLGISGYLLATVHRQENTDSKDRLSVIFNAFDRIATHDCPLVLPIHPRTEKMIRQFDITSRNKYLKIIPPVSFLDMITLEKNARAILTDSGGVQKEAYFHQTPCITLRDETEWTETVEAGWNQVTGINEEEIIRAVDNARPGKIIEDYGKGDAGRKMIELLLDF